MNYMAASATTAIYQDRWNPKSDGKCAISIRITFNRQKKYYQTKFSLTEQNYKRLMSERPRKEFKNILLQLQSLEKKANDIIDKMPFFSFPAFEKAFLQNRGLSDTVEFAFNQYIEQLNNENRIGSALTYKTAKVSLYKFIDAIKIKDRITFSYITPSFLKRYEKWMLEIGNSTTTIGIYLRSLRTLFNIAIADGLITQDFYPFGKRKYQIPASKNTKKALSLADIAAIYNYQPALGTTAERMKDYWMFIYYCNGLNVKDFCRLQHKNIQDDFLVFQRSKTERTKSVSPEIRVPLNSDAKAIIEKHGTKSVTKEAFLFPVLQPSITPVREKQLIQLLVRLINDHMKVIASKLGITNKVTTYVARHSFATVLKRSGASTEFISEALGHSNLKTTQNYLASFEDDKKKEVAKALTAFKNVG
jgi:site-specific recombinase XerD